MGSAIVTISAHDNSYPVKVINITVVPEKIHVDEIEFNLEDVTIEVGNEHTLEYTILPNDATDKSVTFSSSNNDIVTVDDNGKIVGIGSGSAIVTVTTVDGNKSDSISVNVIVPVTGVKFNNDELHLKRGELLDLEYMILPNNATDRRVIFNSLDEGIAMTDIHGRIMGINEGTTTVTITTLDGEYSDTLSVIVTNPVREIELELENLTIEVGEEHTLEYTILPNDATDKSVTFSSSNNDIVTVDDNGKIVGIGSGSAIVTVTTTDGNKSDNILVTVNEKVILSSETYAVKDDFTIVIPDSVTKEMFNSNIYSSYTVSFSGNSQYIGTGTIISIKQSQLLTSSYQVIVYGDVDGNGIIDSIDVNSLVNHVYRNNNLLDGVFLKAADYNHDDKYSLSDIMKMSKKSLVKE